MSTALESQLKAIKSLVQGESAAPKRPFTRPSILFDPKEAADIDLETIRFIAVSGLDVLIETDVRFRHYKNTLFSHKSLDMDREVMTVDENKKINSSISSYLRLLSGYLQFPASQKTLEYLIRRYKVYTYNVDDLVLCVLPYHDTHVFVRVVQILDLSKNRLWGFLEGVKVSGAPMPIKTLVQQCVRHMGVVDAVCSYVMPGNKFLHSQTVVSFCTAIFVQTFGCMISVDNDMVKRVLPLVFACLNPSVANADYMASAMMMVGVIACRAALAHAVVQNLIITLAKIAQQEGGELGDISWLHMSLMGIVNLVQSQSVKMLPWKCVKVLKEIREIPPVLADLVKEYNTEKFLAVYLESLLHYSNSDVSCCHALIGVIEIVPVKNCAVNIICKLLATCAKSSMKTTNPDSLESASWASKVLLALATQYPNELTKAVHAFLQNQNLHPKRSDAVIESSSLMFDGGQKFPLELSNLKLLFSLEHPKAEVRQAALSNLAKTVKEKHDSWKAFQGTINVQAALLRSLQDDDLMVIQVVLSIDGLFRFIDPTCFIKALQVVISKCLGVLRTGNTGSSSIAYDVAVACLVHGLNVLKEHQSTQKEIAAMFFPLLLVLPKTWRLNVKALELVKEVQWPLYEHLFDDTASEAAKETRALGTIISSVNKETIKVLSQNFVKNLEKSIPWLVHCSEGSGLSKLFFLMIVLESFLMEKKAKGGSFLSLFEACFPVLKSLSLNMETKSDIVLAEEVLFKMEELDDVFSDLNVYHRIDSNSEAMNANLIISISWALLDVFSRRVPHYDMAMNPQWNHVLENLYVFFATSSSKGLFRKHLHLLVMGCSFDPVLFVSKFYTEDMFPVSVQVESLHLLAALSSIVSSSAEMTLRNVKIIDLLLAFPSVFVPLCSAEQAVRVAGVDCLEGLYNLWCHMSTSSKQNGSKSTLGDGTFLHSYGEVLELIMQQKRMISLNPDFFSSFLKSLLSSRTELFVPQNLDKRFDCDKKIEIMLFILRSAFKLRQYGKLVLLSVLKGVGNSSVFIEETKPLLSDLLRRRNLCSGVGPEQNLSEVEIRILSVLLENWTSFPCPHDGEGIANNIFGVLQVPNTCKDAAIVKPCLAVLQSLSSEFYDGLRTEMQDKLFQHLVILSRHDIVEIQRAAKDLLMKLHIDSLTICKHLDLLLSQNLTECRSPGASKKSRTSLLQKLILFTKEQGLLHFLFSLLDFVLLKRELERRPSLVEALIKLLCKTLDTEWMSNVASTCETCDVASVNVSPSVKDLTYDLQRLILSVLEDIAASLLSSHPSEQQNPLLEKMNVDLLIDFMRCVEDCTARIQVFSFMTSLTKLVPSQIVDHLIDICMVIGESTVKQDDNRSHQVFEDLICTLVPCWLSRSHCAEKLLQVFIKVLPQISENRRVTLVSCLLRALGEHNSLGLLLVLLFRSMVQRTWKVSPMEIMQKLVSVESEWEHILADQICLQYSCKIWLPSFIDIFKKIGVSDHSLQNATELQVIMGFILHKLEDTELGFNLEAGHDIDSFQGVFCGLMEHVVLQWHSMELKMKQLRVPLSIRNELRGRTHLLLKALMKRMVPAALFGGISILLGNVEVNVKRKALGLLYDYLKGDNMASKKHTRSEGNKHFNDSDPRTNENFSKMTLKVIELVDGPSDISVKLAATSAIEVLAEKYPCNHATLLSCLASVSKQICSEEVTISAGCLRSTGSLVRKLGVGALPLLTSVVTQVLKRTLDVLACTDDTANRDNLNETRHRDSLILSCLATLEALVDGLGDFLNPYLEDIVKLLILNQDFISESDHKIKLKASAVQGLLSEKISVRLILVPLLKMYPLAINCGELSLSLAFEMIAALVTKMDRTSVGSCHAKIFEQCLVALDVRRQHPVSIKNIDMVEESIISTMVLLTMKLTEGLFKPLFMKSLEWADSELEEVGPTRTKSIHRSIAFYKLVNRLAEQHRSLFVPYFKYLTESCIHHLTAVLEDFHISATKKQKKSKVRDSYRIMEGKPLTAAQWHLRALVISSLHKCFLYDTGNLKFLDSPTFQVLLKPIVSQLIVDPPTLSEQNAVIPTVLEVDDLLISCLGQMALTAGTDLLWKPLNHEVLMQTRNEKIRPRILGLKIVKYLLENLKEEYLIFLPETIPFLGELLEDAELQVKSLAQDILREMESLSGENLRQYL